MTDSEKLQLILDKVTSLETDMQTVNGRLDKMDGQLDKIESKLEMLHVWQKKTAEHVAELKVMQELFELNTNKRFARLQDGLETIEEILKLNDLIPR